MSLNITTHKTHIYFMKSTFTITLDEITMQLLISLPIVLHLNAFLAFELVLGLHWINWIGFGLHWITCRSINDDAKFSQAEVGSSPSVCWQNATPSPPSSSPPPSPSTPPSCSSTSLPPHTGAVCLASTPSTPGGWQQTTGGEALPGSLLVPSFCPG